MPPWRVRKARSPSRDLLMRSSRSGQTVQLGLYYGWRGRQLLFRFPSRPAAELANDNGPACQQALESGECGEIVPPVRVVLALPVGQASVLESLVRLLKINSTGKCGTPQDHKALEADLLWGLPTSPLWGYSK